MIVATNAEVEKTDAASTHTLVVEQPQKVPPHLPKVIYLSFVVATLAFVFAIVDNVYNHWSNVPKGVSVIVLAYILTLPHHGAILLLNWLQRHQTDSILAFKPFSPRTLAYSTMCLVLWAGSAAVCSRNLYFNSRPYPSASCIPSHRSSTGFFCNPVIIHPGVDIYGNSLASTVTSALETIIAFSITVTCVMQHRRLNKTNREAPSPTPISTPNDSKVISA